MLESHQGLSGLNSRQWSQSSIFQVGHTDIGRKVSSRTVTLSFHVRGDDRAGLEVNRRRLSALLIPGISPLRLEVIGHDGNTRTGNGFPVKPSLLNSKERLGHLMKGAVQIEMPDPLFYGENHELNISGTVTSGGGLGFPMALPMSSGGCLLYTSPSPRD